MSVPRTIYEMVYKRTLKRSRLLHSLVYEMVRIVLVPIMERTSGFYTMDDDPLWFRIELITGNYEKETVKLAQQLVRPGMTVLDIGAHVGYYTRLFSKLVGDAGRVIAFEPHPLTFNVLCNNVRALRNVIPVQVAVADQEGSATLFDFLTGASESSLRYDEHIRGWCRSHLSGRDRSPRVLRDFPVATYAVRTTMVDSYLAEVDIERVDFIKMDIEGAEIGAIRGMKRTIQSSPRLSMIMEFNPRALQSFGVDPARALEELREIGFARMRIAEGNSGVTEVGNDAMITGLVKVLTERTAKVNLLCEKRVES